MTSIEDQLLASSILCGLTPTSGPAYRLQLFLVANRDLCSRNHVNDFQRALETGVDVRSYWRNAGGKGSGEYSLTTAGWAAASLLSDAHRPKYTPVPKASFRCELRGTIGSTTVRIVNIAGKANVFLDESHMSTGVEACKQLGEMTGTRLNPTGTSAVRQLYDLAIDHRFEITFD